MPVGSLNGYPTSVWPSSGWWPPFVQVVVLVEEPDFVTIYGAGEPVVLRRVVVAAMRHLEATGPVEVE